MKFLKILLAAIFFPGLFTHVDAQKPRIEKEPSWVAHNTFEFDKVTNTGDVEDGYLNLVVERQVNIGNQSVFARRVYKVVSEAGVQNSSEIDVSYDPSYQQLSFHTIQVIRDGKVINKLNLSKIKTIQQEKELDRSIYNGSLTAVLFLEDVRKGDIIEYAFTLKGFNPVFNDKYFTHLPVQYSIPVKNVFYKIVCPASRKLNIKNKRTSIEPVITTSGSDKIYQWKIDDPAPLKTPDRVPAWYEPYGEILISEYDSWAQVVQWAIPLFTNKMPLSNELRNKIEEIKKENTDLEKQVLAAIRFVQDDVRYLGIEMGSNSHKPNSPNTILGRRFGDCKDKSYLLCTMLDALEVDASPVLINAQYGKALQQWLPSPGAFDHATVRLFFNNRYYYIDPTISFQRGALKNLSYPDYQVGLVLKDTTTVLTNIPLQDSGMVSSKELFSMDDISGPANLTITTTYSGSFADDIRSQLRSNSLADLQKNYRDFYNKIYEGTTVKDSMKVKEDDATGNITTTEYYTVKHLWNLEKGVKKAEFYGLLINDYLHKPGDRDRTMPVSLVYPTHYKEEIEVHLPMDWNFDNSEVEIKTDAYRFSQKTYSTERNLQLVFEYQTLKDNVETKDVEKLFSDYEEMKKALGYELTYGDEVKTNKQSKVSDIIGTAVAVIVLLGVMVMIIIVVKRKD